MPIYQYSSTPLYVEENQSIQFRYEAPPGFSEIKQVTIKIGELTVFWIIETKLEDFAPDPFFFQEMRTEKQLGYLVGVGYVPIHRFPGIAFYIQSPHSDSSALRSCIDEFIEQCSVHLENMADDNWHHLQHGLAGQLKEKDASLRVTSQRFWAAICNKDKLATFELTLNMPIHYIFSFHHVALSHDGIRRPNAHLRLKTSFN